jgi:hypothetical protein
MEGFCRDSMAATNNIGFIAITGETTRLLGKTLAPTLSNFKNYQTSNAEL